MLAPGIPPRNIDKMAETLEDLTVLRGYLTGNTSDAANTDSLQVRVCVIRAWCKTVHCSPSSRGGGPAPQHVTRTPPLPSPFPSISNLIGKLPTTGVGAGGGILPQHPLW